MAPRPRSRRLPSLVLLVALVLLLVLALVLVLVLLPLLLVVLVRTALLILVRPLALPRCGRQRLHRLAHRAVERAPALRRRGLQPGERRAAGKEAARAAAAAEAASAEAGQRDRAAAEAGRHRRRRTVARRQQPRVHARGVVGARGGALELVSHGCAVLVGREQPRLGQRLEVAQAGGQRGHGVRHAQIS